MLYAALAIVAFPEGCVLFEGGAFWGAVGSLVDTLGQFAGTFESFSGAL
jgi:hypothetical protein